MNYEKKYRFLYSYPCRGYGKRRYAFNFKIKEKEVCTLFTLLKNWREGKRQKYWLKMMTADFKQANNRLGKSKRRKKITA